MENRDWVEEELDLQKLRNLVSSYAQRDPEFAVPALKRIAALVKDEVRECKDGLRVMALPADKHPSPNFSGEEETETLISHVLDLLAVIESDFTLLKKDFEKDDLPTASRGAVNLRFLIGCFRSSMLERMVGLVIKEVRAQKLEDLLDLIYSVMSRTVNKRMVAVVVGFIKNPYPNPAVALEKLKRIRKCLRDVIAVLREFIVTHPFVPQPSRVSKLSQPLEKESPTSVFQHVSDADALIDDVYKCMDVISDCAFHKLEMDQLEAVEALFLKMKKALEKCAVDEGAVYLEALEE